MNAIVQQLNVPVIISGCVKFLAFRVGTGSPRPITTLCHMPLPVTADRRMYCSVSRPHPFDVSEHEITCAKNFTHPS